MPPLNLVFSAFKRAWGFLGGMECGQYMCRVSKLMLQFCSYLYALPQRINLKEGQYTISVLVSPFPRKLTSLESKLLQNACWTCVSPCLSCNLGPTVLRYFPCFPSWAQSQHCSEPVCWTPCWTGLWTFLEAPGSSLSWVNVSRGFLLCPFVPVLSNCSGSICQLPGQHICYTGRALQQGL